MEMLEVAPKVVGGLMLLMIAYLAIFRGDRNVAADVARNLAGLAQAWGLSFTPHQGGFFWNAGLGGTPRVAGNVAGLSVDISLWGGKGGPSMTIFRVFVRGPWQAFDQVELPAVSDALRAAGMAIRPPTLTYAPHEGILMLSLRGVRFSTQALSLTLHEVLRIARGGAHAPLA